MDDSAIKAIENLSNDDQDDKEVRMQKIIDDLKGLIRPSATIQDFKSDDIQGRDEQINSLVRKVLFLWILF